MMSARTQDWPAWRYGPKGEGKIFQQVGDVPEGWVDHPSKLPPAPEKLDESGDERQALREEKSRLRAEYDAAAREGRKQVERLVKENERLREENKRLQEQVRALSIAVQDTTPPAAEGAQLRSARSGPRKLSAAPVTPVDTSITLDEGRTERLRVLRGAGVTIEDDATDGDIEEALDWLETQGEKS